MNISYREKNRARKANKVSASSESEETTLSGFNFLMMIPRWDHSGQFRAVGSLGSKINGLRVVRELQLNNKEYQ